MKQNQIPRTVEKSNYWKLVIIHALQRHKDDVWHYRTSCLTACGINPKYASEYPEETTCKSCRRTKVWKEAMFNLILEEL